MMAQSRHRGDPFERDYHGGFAMIEIMLALMLIAVLAALAMPAMVRTTGPAALRLAAFEVSALLREDRNEAQRTGRTFATRVDAQAGRVFAGASSASIALPSGATAHVLETRSPSVQFFADGRSSGGVILIETVAAHYAITVRRDTGAIRVDAQ